jgi:hypothetical protein
MFLKIEPAVQGEGWSMTASTSIRFEKILSSPYSLKSPRNQNKILPPVNAPVFCLLPGIAWHCRGPVLMIK